MDPTVKAGLPRAGRWLSRGKDSVLIERTAFFPFGPKPGALNAFMIRVRTALSSVQRRQFIVLIMSRQNHLRWDSGKRV